MQKGSHRLPFLLCAAALPKSPALRARSRLQVFRLQPFVNSTPTPALVTQRAAQRLPRLALLLFCAAYLLPGLFGRDPWKNADITAFGYMVNIANGVASAWTPTIAGLPSDGGLLPYWIGALAVKLLGPWFGQALAARLPFMLLLAAVLMLTWYSTYYLAKTEAAQPVAFAFGGEAHPVDYARAIADGALLALIASLGLLQLGHETTPELVQLASACLFLLAMAISPYKQAAARVAVLVSLPVLAASGSPVVAVALAILGVAVSALSSYEQVRRFSAWIGVAGLVAAMVATGLAAWEWKLGSSISLRQIGRLLVWFTWPAWPLVAWALWRWRHHLKHRHIAVPLGMAAVGVVTCIAMGGSDRALMLALPPLAVLASFALPTLQRSVSAAIDWFSVFFFSFWAIACWVVYAAMHTGVPAKTMANVMKLAPGFTPEFSAIAFAIAALGTLAWLGLVRWRTGRQQHALWKSMVLPASGVALCWLLVMTLWLPLLDYARSYRPLVERISRHVPTQACIAAPGQPRSLMAALEYFGGYRVDGVRLADQSDCDFLITSLQARAQAVEMPGWRLLGRERRPTERDLDTAIYRRTGR